MITTFNSIGRIVFFLETLKEKQKDIFSSEVKEKEISQKPISDPLQNDIEDLLDLIRIRINNSNIEELSKRLYPKIFSLRFKVYESIIERNIEVETYLKKTINITSKRQVINEHLSLKNEVENVIISHHDIVSAILLNSEKERFGKKKYTSENTPKYEQLEYLSVLPSPQYNYLKKLIDTSLKIDVALIISEMILSGKLEYEKEKIESELIPFLRENIVKYGAYSMFIGIWKPKEFSSSLKNRMKILSSKLEMDHGNFFTFSNNEFQKEILN